LPAFAQPAAELSRPRVIDGDTLEDTATGERIRLENIDTPETNDRARCEAEREAGNRATNEARHLISSAHEITISRTGRSDVYGRTIAFVTVDGRDYGQHMMDAGLARPWRGHREPWCGPNGELRE
jgi:endonuclease YncB( thermonuclease family)